MEVNYGKRRPFSLGVEEEFQLVNGESYELSSRFDEVFEAAGSDPRVKAELMQSIVEVATHVAETVPEAVEEARGLRAQLRDAAAESGALIASAGTHPFSRYEHQEITDAPRYQELVETMQWVAERELIFGLHVHVGLESAQQAIAVANGLRTWLPELLALSVNSPFWQARDTGLASTRVKLFDAFPRSGLPPAFSSFEEFELLVERGVKTGSFEDYTYIWWDLRPHPKLGTIEVRICDGQTRLENVAGLVALIQSLAATVAERSESEGARRSSRGRWSRRTSGAPRATGSTRSWSTSPGTRCARRARPRWSWSSSRCPPPGGSAARPSWTRSSTSARAAAGPRSSGGCTRRKGACWRWRSGSRSRRSQGCRTGVAARSVGYPDWRRTPRRRSLFSCGRRSRKESAAGPGSTATAGAVLPPGALTPVTLYRQPPPPRRGVAARVGRFFAWAGAAFAVVVVGVVGGFYLWAHESVALLRPTSAEGQQTQARLDPPKSAAIALVLGYDHRAGDGNCPLALGHDDADPGRPGHEHDLDALVPA